MTAHDLVRLDINDDVALLSLNRPSRMNALTGPMVQRYFDLLDVCMASPEVRVVVVTGVGRGFCVGADVAGLDARIGDPDAPSVSVDGRSFVDTISQPKPVIAAINGACAGLGMVIALSCDLRFAAAGAKFTTSFARRGLVAEKGLSWLLPRVVGTGAAMDLLLSARVLLAEEARGMGLIDRLVHRDRLLAETLEYASDLARNCSPQSMAQIKRQVWRDLERPFDDAIKNAEELLRTSLDEPDFAEGVASFREGREPRFQALDFV